MTDRVIEPSEIIIEKDGTVREDTSRVNPWIRFLARFFDYSLFFLLIGGVRVLTRGVLPAIGRFEHLIPLEYFAWIPLEALLLTALGTTPGKFLLKTRIKQGRKTKLNFEAALRRSFNVWFRGLGMGIPIVNVVCLLVAYQRLKLLRFTSWDRDENCTVTHAPIGRWRIGLAALVAVGGLFFYYNVAARLTFHG